MLSLLKIPLSADKLWEFSFVLVAFYLLLHPVLAFPASLAVVMGGGLLLLLFRSVPPEIPQSMGKAWCLFLIFLLASPLWSLSPGITLQSTGLVFLGTLLYIMGRASQPTAQGRIEMAALGLAFLASFLALYQWFFGFENLTPLLPQLSGEEHEILNAAIHNKRASGPFVTHGALAAFLILFIPIGFVLMKIKSGFKKALFGILTLTLVAGLLTTQSVGACFCLTLAALLVLLKRRSKATLAAVTAAGAVGIILLISARGVQSWFLAAFGTRLILWKAVLTLFASHPWLGTGLGTFDEAYQQAGLSFVTGARFTHNVFLQVLVETGLAGFLIFSAVLIDLARRLKMPSRWEGWGVGTGVLAFLLFSLMDLPFQMPELVWIFAVVAARLEFRPGKPFSIPKIPLRWVEYGFLVVLLISGFWPPLRPWNFALLAVALWALMGLFQQKFDQVPLWIFAGGLFMGLRAFVSPSAMGTVWFLEISGILLAFYLVLPCFEKPERFLKMFFCLGLVWAIKVWEIYFHYPAPGFSNWIHFQYSDVKDWMIFGDPKRVGIFLVALVLWYWRKPLSFSKVLAASAGFLTLVRLKASSPLAGLGAGIFYRIWFKSRLRAVIFLLAAGGFLISYRMINPSSTSNDRLFIWKDSCKVWLMNPFIGVGPGAFAGLYHIVKTPRASGVSRFLMDAQYSHNEFLELLTAFGLIGFVFVLFLFAKVWRRVRDQNYRQALVGLGAASFVDFCLHTPLIALQGAGLLTAGEARKPRMSFAGGFLILGLAAGLFGSPIFSGVYKSLADSHLSQNQILPADLRGLETAERLNSWDARIPEAKAQYLEVLFFATKDPVWSRRSDETFERVLNLEKAEGQWPLEKAERLTRRLSVDLSPQAFQKADEAWYQARVLLPRNAFQGFEQGLFFLEKGEKDKALLQFETAEEREPNYAAAWVNEGLLFKEKKEPAKASAAFQKALEIYQRWKDADRIDPLEKQMVYLPPETVNFLKKETAK